MQTREEHMIWCKKRATAEYDFYFPRDGAAAASRNARASILSDLGKHPETKGLQGIAGMLIFAEMNKTSREEVQRFVDGFN